MKSGARRLKNRNRMKRQTGVRQSFLNRAPLLVALFSILVPAMAQAQIFTTLKSFGVTNITGLHPRSQLEQGPDGTLYGTTADGGSSYRGTVFKLNSDGSGFTVLKVFTDSIDGANPYAGLTVSGSVLYGTTRIGGSPGYGTVFKLNTDGTGYTVLKHFNDSDGAIPLADLTLSGSVLYGTTAGGGSSSNGVVFKMNTDGTGYTVLKHFTGGDGAYPQSALTLSGNVLYGTTYLGGFWDYGTVFKLNTDGSGYAVLKHFSGVDDGAWPGAGVILSGSMLYGTTAGGGSSDYGTVFKLDLSGALTPIPLALRKAAGGAIILEWSNPAFALQAAPKVTGTYTNIPGATSPYTNVISEPQRYFRLIGN